MTIDDYQAAKTADEVKARLTGRWPDDRYLHVYEAPMDHARQGAKIDVLVLGLWKSKGWPIEAVEVKVSYSDWCKEWRRTVWDVTTLHGVHTQHQVPSKWQIESWTPGTNEYGWRHRRCDHEHPEGFTPSVERRHMIDTSKNAVIREHADRFWIAAPADLARRIADDCRTILALSTWGVLAVHDTRVDVLVPAVTNKDRKPLTHAKYLGIIRAAADSGLRAIERAEARGRERGYKEGRSAGAPT